MRGVRPAVTAGSRWTVQRSGGGGETQRKQGGGGRINTVIITTILKNCKKKKKVERQKHKRKEIKKATYSLPPSLPLSPSLVSLHDCLTARLLSISDPVTFSAAAEPR